MNVLVDLERVTVTIAGVDDTSRFAVEVTGPPGAAASRVADVHRLGAVLLAANVGRLSAQGDAFIDPDAVRFHAEGQVSDAWDQRFEAMIAFARSKGWVAEDGALHAHVVWPDAANGPDPGTL